MRVVPARAGAAARRLVLLVGALASAALFAALATPSASPVARAMDDLGTINVSIVYRAFGGAPPGPSVTPNRSLESPAAGLEVRVAPPGGGPPVATATTDATGAATLIVPPGTYWLYVPRPADPAASGQPATIVTQMPDGTVVRTWRTVEVAPGASLAVQLGLTVPQP